MLEKSGSTSGMFAIEGKTAIVTGATKGIGNAIALGLAKHGKNNIVVVSRHQEDCNRVAGDIEKLGSTALPLAVDVSRVAAIEEMVNKTVERFGSIDILVNNAGSTITKKAEDLTEEDWDRVVNVNLRGSFFCAQIVGRQMIKQKYGNIINMASMYGFVGDRYLLPYIAAKGGLIQVTRGLALEWARYNIRVNAICPGYILTEFNREMLDKNENLRKYINNLTPMNRIGQPEEIVGAALFLASDASSFMTGSLVVVDGGWTIA